MKVSIRNFLLINLLLTIIMATFLTAVGNYYLDSKDIRLHLDLLLGQASFDFQALLGQDFHSRDLVKLQQGLDDIPSDIKKSLKTADEQNLLKYEEKYQFLVWNDDGKLVLHSADAPNISFLKSRDGFANITVNGVKWRAFSRYNSKQKIYITVAEQFTSQILLAHSLAVDDIYIMLIVYPIAAILIWLIVGQGLKSILRVTYEVSHRAPNFLDPVNAQSVPKEIKPLVIELNKLFQRLHQAIEREKRFAGDAAHELRTPLAALKTQAQVALKADNEEERHKLLQNAIIGVDRCTHIVQQLLTLSRLVPESNTLVDSCLLDLSKLAAEIVAQLAPLALDKDIDIELLSDEFHPAIIQGNITALSILIRNLVDNAIRYTPENGKITISVANKLDKVILKVTDNGPGIPAELRARVFERFFRVLGNKSPGSGLGLAIVQQIAQLHNAQLRLGTPDSGKGLEVEVAFQSVSTNTEVST